MPDQPVIHAENVGKRYWIGQRQSYRALRDSIAEFATHPWRLIAAARGRTRGREEFWALRDVSFEVRRGDVVGLIGRNGAGKSTLLKILSRITEPTTGRIEIQGRVGSLLEVGTGFHPELTGRENIFLNGAILGMKRGEIAGKFDRIVEFAELAKFIDTPVKHFSSGMYTRLAFSVAAHLEPEVLLVDEVLAVGDAAFQKKCLGKMEDVSREGRTVVFVSHNMAAIAQLCGRGICLQSGKVWIDDSGEEAVRRYLDLIDSARAVGADLSARHARGHGGLCVSRVVVDGGDGCAAARSLGPCRIRLDYAAEGGRAPAELFASIFVEDRRGGLLFCCSTAMYGGNLLEAPALGSVVCRIASLPLIPGSYWIGVKLKDRSGVAFELERIASFVVEDNPFSGIGSMPSGKLGSVLVPHRWGLEPGPEV